VSENDPVTPRPHDPHDREDAVTIPNAEVELDGLNEASAQIQVRTLAGFDAQLRAALEHVSP